MSHWSQLTHPVSDLLDEVRRSLTAAPAPGQRRSTPRHEALAIGLGSTIVTTRREPGA